MSVSDLAWGRGMRVPAADDAAASANNEQAIARYRYMLKTAPPEQIEQAHAEAFGRLTPEQREVVLQQIAAELPAAERPLAGSANATPQGMARLATRAEIRQPGAMERMFGGSGRPGLGGMFAGSLLGSIAGTVLGSMIAREFFADPEHHAAGGEDATGMPAEEMLAENDLPIDDAGDFGLGDIDLV